MMEISFNEKPLVHLPSLKGYRDVRSEKPVAEFIEGRFVLLHFFTGGCVNCLHTLAELERIEWPEELVLVGVHTGKFDREKEDGWIKAMIARYGIDHPVINDADGKLKSGMAVRAWPTLILASAEGYEIARASGEGRAEGILEKFYAYRGERELKRMQKRAIERGDARFAFCRVYADARHLYLSDIGLGAVHVLTRHGRIFKTIERFAEPQGLFAKGGRLYVADRAAGRIVAIDLHTWSVTILAEGLRSPTGLTGNGEGLQIAVSSSHQIWQMDYEGGGLKVLAGSGTEDVRDGRVDEACFAQPTDLDWLDEALYVIDAEGSALRKIEKGRVETLIGWDLFTFGDRDDIGKEARLQHPEGLCAGIGGCGNHRIFIADTYNDKVKVYDPLTGRVTTLLQKAASPTGVVKAGCDLFVVELGQDRLVRFDISTLQSYTMEITE
ncbi:hypothetical protein [Hydrogenimonas urashimensis]|uniref:hypothetical protein n=1 Tax=Hydrogenimonas urashimensis TaxID=2740515 RepID=UPI001915362B|nr:hypothetical protein [Hydrogenimonas urashimensis]